VHIDIYIDLQVYRCVYRIYRLQSKMQECQVNVVGKLCTGLFMIKEKKTIEAEVKHIIYSSFDDVFHAFNWSIHYLST
jgi:hypothetical protein